MRKRTFTGKKLKQLREDYKKLGTYKATAEAYRVDSETVRFALKSSARKSYSEARAKYKKNNPEKFKKWVIKASRKYRRNNLEKARACDRKAKKKWAHAHPEIVMFRNAQWKSRKQGLPFDLSVFDIRIPTLCPVLSIPLKRGRKRTDNTPSLDQINRERGYVKGNVAVISWRANRLKSDATLQELSAITAYVRRNERKHERSHRCGR